MEPIEFHEEVAVRNNSITFTVYGLSFWAFEGRKYDQGVHTVAIETKADQLLAEAVKQLAEVGNLGIRLGRDVPTGEED